MHPTSTFHWADRVAMLAFVRAHAFGTLVDASLRVAQVPVIVDEAGERLLLHFSRGNPMSRAMPLCVVAVFSGAHGYVSPNWYVKGDQVPTWNYESVEVEGTLSPTDEAGLTAILTELTRENEKHIEGPAPWTMDRLSLSTREKLVNGIVGATLSLESVRGTQKLSQNKSPEDFAGVLAGLRASRSPENEELAARMALANGRPVTTG